MYFQIVLHISLGIDRKKSFKSSNRFASSLTMLGNKISINHEIFIDSVSTDLIPFSIAITKNNKE